MYLIMTWLFIAFTLMTHPLYGIAMRMSDTGNIVRKLILIMPVLILVVMYGLFRLYRWAVNTALIIFALCFVFPLINVYIRGIL